MHFEPAEKLKQLRGMLEAAEADAAMHEANAATARDVIANLRTQIEQAERAEIARTERTETASERARRRWGMVPGFTFLGGWLLHRAREHPVIATIAAGATAVTVAAWSVVPTPARRIPDHDPGKTRPRRGRPAACYHPQLPGRRSEPDQRAGATLSGLTRRPPGRAPPQLGRTQARVSSWAAR